MAPPTGEFRSRQEAEQAVREANERKLLREHRPELGSGPNVASIIERGERAKQYLARQQPSGRTFDDGAVMRQGRQGRKPAPPAPPAPAAPAAPPAPAATAATAPYDPRPDRSPLQYAAEDLSTDRGLLDPSDPRVVESNRRGKVRAEGKALADIDALTARRSGQLRRARERPMSQGGGLYSLLTGGRDRDRDYYNTARDRMMNVYDDEGEKVATRTRPGADVGMSPGGRYVDLRERRVPEAIRKRRAEGKGSRSWRTQYGPTAYNQEGDSTNTGPVGSLRTDPATGLPKPAGSSIKVSDATRAGRDKMRSRMKLERDAARANLRRERGAGQPQAGGGITGFGDVPQVPQAAHPFASWSPQMRALHQARLMGSHGREAQKSALDLQRGADSHQSSLQAGYTGRYRATQAAHQAAAGEGDPPDEPGTVTTGDRAAFTGMHDNSQTGDAVQRSRALAGIWNGLHRAQETGVDRYSVEDFVRHVVSTDPKRWGGRQDEIRRFWLLTRERFHGTDPLKDPSTFGDEDESPGWSSLWMGDDPDEHKFNLPLGGQPPPGSSPSGPRVPGVTTSPSSPGDMFRSMLTGAFGI